MWIQCWEAARTLHEREWKQKPRTVDISKPTCWCSKVVLPIIYIMKYRTTSSLVCCAYLDSIHIQSMWSCIFSATRWIDPQHEIQRMQRYFKHSIFHNQQETPMSGRFSIPVEETVIVGNCRTWVWRGCIWACCWSSDRVRARFAVGSAPNICIWPALNWPCWVLGLEAESCWGELFMGLMRMESHFNCRFVFSLLGCV